MTNMNTFGITDCFEAFISGSECENGKPDPEIFQKAAEAIGQKAANCIVVEDSEAGVKAAKSAKNEMHWICTKKERYKQYLQSGRYRW